MPLAGLRVIEASAGTGKTFTLAALYVRLVLGHGCAIALYPPQILVMTFTDAATSELRERVRHRLAEAARYFKDVKDLKDPIGAASKADGFLQSLRASYAPTEWSACAQRLDMAAQWMDDAAIFTIHGWSSRMLKQHAFDSASLFQQSRVEDGDKLRLTAAQDYWRRWFYPLTPGQLGALKAVGNTPDAMLENLKPLWAAAERAPLPDAVPPQAAGADPLALVQAWDAWQSAYQPLEAAARSACTPALIACLSDVIAAKSLKNYRKDWPGKLAAWAAGEATLALNKTERKAALATLLRFSASTLQAKGWAGASEHPAFVAIEALHQQLQAEPDVASGLLQHAATQIAASYRSAKNALAQFDFSDLLQCLYHALQAPDGRLAAAIRKQYPVALVDEFQDTDPWQYGALSKIYGESRDRAPDPALGLVMIGDPKQAIYSFRGADLATYLQARQQAQSIHTLSGNYRSTGAVVAAVNHVFSHADRPFGEVPFDAVVACNAEVLPLPVNGAAQPALTVWQLDHAKPPRKEVFLRQMAALFATQMVGLLNARAAAPGQMAVLVRDGAQARAIRQALSARGVRSVYLSERDSVFATQEAQDLWRVLCAVANPRSTALVRAALATRLWGLPFAALEVLLQDEEAWDALVECFHGWQAVWQRQGFLPMLHRLLHDQSIPARLLNPADAAGNSQASNDGERRLTNLLHLGDLLQTAAASLQGEAALVRHLEQQLHHPKASGDTAQLRLESDANLVQVITIHKSKGLQYPLVFLPFASVYRKEDADSGTDDADRLAEDIRLLYVALTRTERALWLGVAQQKGDVDGAEPKLRSALSFLLQRQSPDDLGTRLQGWAACPDIRVERAPDADDSQYLPQAVVKHWKPVRQPGRRLQSRWWTASFSALTRELMHASTGAADASVTASARDAQLADAQVDSAPGASEPANEMEVVLAVPALNSFPAGSRYGTLLHDLLEWQFERGWPIANADAAGGNDWRALLQRKAQRLKLDDAQTALLSVWLQRIVQARLLDDAAGGSAPLTLAALDRQTAWAEMGFTLPVHALAANRLDALISQHVLQGQPRSPLQSLQPLQLEGMLIGFMDLVLQHGGRYFVLDYKSNRLDAYAASDLQGAILAHRYDVQYTLYTLALHRLLKSRLPDYDYEQHMGGAIYLFLRGVDQPGGGVFADRPPRELIEALDAAFARLHPEAEEPA
jgi:exodeoxyribonuclease V beta subunit